MKLRTPLYKLLCAAMATLAVICCAVSLFTGNSPLDTDHIAEHVTRHTQSRISKLDAYSDRLMDKPQPRTQWPVLDGFPDDMVIYKYVCDTLYSWYNLFNVGSDDIAPRSVVQRLSSFRSNLASPLAKVTEEPSYINLGTKWYIVKARRSGEVKIIEGLLVKERHTISRAVHLHGKYDIKTLSESEGSPVVLDGKPVFKVTEAETSSAAGNVSIPSFVLRLAALLLLLAALLLRLYHNRTLRCCGISLAVITVLAAVMRLWENSLTDFSYFFSPALFAHDWLLDSFASLLVLNTAIFLAILCIWWCRGALSVSLAGGRRPKVCGVAVLSLLCALTLWYSIYSLSSIVSNSSINLELHRLSAISWYSVAVYISYAFLFTGVLLLAETAVRLICEGRQASFTLLSTRRILLYCVAAALCFSIPTMVIGFNKEIARVNGWSSRLALDRDLEMELELRGLEESIAADPVLSNLSGIPDAGALIVHRLEEMYFAHISQNYDISATALGGRVDTGDRHVLRMLSRATPVAPGSNFAYSYNPVSGSRYVGLFRFDDGSGNPSGMIVGITPKYARGMSGGNFGSVAASPAAGIPRYYSYAKYNNDRLASFRGNYPYPMVLEGMISASNAGRQHFVADGYRHFVKEVSEDETVVISRRERDVMMYFVSFSFLVLLLFLIGVIFRQDGNHRRVGAHFFSTRMRRLVVWSLFITLVVMAGMSVLFVYQRNDRNLTNIMSGRISAIQVMLERSCRHMNSYEDMNGASFASELEDISRGTGSDISLYSPGGRLFVSTSQDIADRVRIGSRIDPDAFRSIVFAHQRYFIKTERSAFQEIFRTMYCPVFNEQGNAIAIAGVPYRERDYDFTRDAVMHAATIISLFLILLFITVLLSSSITSAIFRPLLEMSSKMKGGDSAALEEIEYSGNDEISSLVAAYNTMVSDLRESTARLAAAERDKAWSEMARQVAHEIKNPLTPIKLEIQRLCRLKQKNDPSWTEKFDRVSEVVLEHIDILSQTANEFSTFARLYSEQPSEICLDSALKDQIMLFGDKGAEITYLGMENAVMMGPKPQIIRVFVNLLSNAVQAVSGQEDPKVLVSLRRSASGSGWDVVFEDNGPGVSEENQPHLFTPNFTTKSSGTGLGLAICRSIVTRCGGTIGYSRSFALGGACFTVFLPSERQ